MGRVGEVLLVFPGKFKSPNPQVPLSLLHLASILLRDGLRVRLADLRLEDLDDVKIGNPVFVGISCIHGSQIRFGLEFARRVRAYDPSIPIVWGGVHPTLLPEQTVKNAFVDVVVRGEGESIIADLARRLRFGEPLDSVKGITFKNGETTRSTPDWYRFLTSRAKSRIVETESTRDRQNANKEKGEYRTER